MQIPHLEWNITVYSHKCYHYLGEVNVSVPYPTSAEGKIASLFPKEWFNETWAKSITTTHMIPTDVLTQMEQDLSRMKIDKRSVRRSGAQFWARAGMPKEELRKITMHTSLVTLDAYLALA